MTGRMSKIWVALALALFASWAVAGDLQIKDAWIKAAPPGVKVMAAYMEIQNPGQAQQVLVGVTSPAFARVEMHRTVISDNMAKMEQIQDLAIPAQGSVVMQPGGLHLMLMDPIKPLNAGDKVPMTIALGSGEQIPVTAVVRAGKMGGMPAQQPMGHDGHRH